MIRFQERFFRPLESSLHIKCCCRIHFTECGGFDRVISAAENKIMWPELSDHEICMREVYLPYNSEDFSITCLHNILLRGQNFLYITLSPRQQDEERCHILCASLTYEENDDDGHVGLGAYGLALLQDFSCAYCPVDMQHLAQDAAAVCLLVLGSDKLLHVYDVDSSSGLLRRSSHSRRKNLRHEWAHRLDLSRHAQDNEATGQVARRGAPLRLLCEKWGAAEGLGGTQGLVGHMDGLLCWDYRSDAGSGSAQMLGDSSQHKEKEKEGMTDATEDVGGGGQDVVGLEEGEEGNVRSRSRSTEVGLRADLSPIFECDDEDSLPLDLDLSPLSAAAQRAASAGALMQRVLTEPPLFCTRESTSTTDTGQRACSSKNALLLDGCVSCMKFFRREGVGSRRFRRVHGGEQAHLSVDSSSGDNGGDLLNEAPLPEAIPAPAVLIGSSDGGVALLSLQGDHVKALLLPAPLDSMPAVPLCRSSSPPPPPLIDRGASWSSTSEQTASAAQENVVMALCVSDITGDNCNEVVVGYQHGLVRVARLVIKRKSSIAECLAPPAEENVEGWCVDDLDFAEVAQVKLPFPVVSIECGQLLGFKFNEARTGDNKLAVLRQQLVVYTTRSVHVFSVLGSKMRVDEQQRAKEEVIKSILRNVSVLLSEEETTT